MQYRYVLDRFTGGLLFYYFGNVDQIVAHDVARPDPGHPAYDAGQSIPSTRMSSTSSMSASTAIVGETLDALGPDGTLIVLSDHGFTSWRRSFHLNTWLKSKGFLTLANPSREDDPGFFGNVDWSRTRAYGIGLNGLYINVQGREKSGAVAPADRERVMEEIAAKLLQTIDPATGQRAITKVYRREQVYTDAGYFDRAPDLVVGYAKGTRGSDESALGSIPPERDRRQHGSLEWRPLHGSRGGARRPAVEPAASKAGAVARQSGGGGAGGVRGRGVSACATVEEAASRELVERRTRNVRIGQESSSTRRWWRRVKRYADIAGYSSVEEFITHALEKEIKQLDEADSEEEIKKRLKGLGYIS